MVSRGIVEEVITKGLLSVIYGRHILCWDLEQLFEKDSVAIHVTFDTCIILCYLVILY